MYDWPYFDRQAKVSRIATHVALNLAAKRARQRAAVNSDTGYGTLSEFEDAIRRSDSLEFLPMVGSELRPLEPRKHVAPQNDVDWLVWLPLAAVAAGWLYGLCLVARWLKG